MKKYLATLIAMSLTACGAGNSNNSALTPPNIVAIGSNGTIIGSVDGNTWETMPSITTNDLRSVAYFNPGSYNKGENFFTAVGTNGTVIYSYLNTTTWQQAAWQDLSSIDLYSVHSWYDGLNSSTILMAGVNPSDGAGAVLTGSNLTINQYASESIGYKMSAIVPNQHGDIVMVGDKGLIFYTSFSENEVWIAAEHPTSNNLNGLIDDGYIYIAVGDNGTIVKGENYVWSQESSPTTNNLQSVYCGNNACIAVGESGTILHSNDAQNWIQENSPTKAQLNFVTFWNDQFWIVGDGGIMLKSSDGQNWTNVDSGTKQNLYGINGD